MADVSLDEVIAQRRFTWSGGRGRGTARGRGRGRGQGRGGGGGRGRGNFNMPTRIQVAKTLANRGRFSQTQQMPPRDARLKIGMTDARQKIQQKIRQTDARERLNQKAKKTDARLKLNARRSIEEPSQQSGSVNMESGTPKITIQNPKALTNTVTIKTTPRPRPQQSAVKRLSNKVTANSGELKITTVNEMARKRKSAPPMSMPPATAVPMSYSAYIERRQHKQEIVEDFEDDNLKEEEFDDEFDFIEPEPVPVPAKISRLLQKPAAPPKPKANELLGSGVSPLQGTRMLITNLHPTVTEEDIEELFGAIGALKRARLLKQGSAEVVFVRNEDALEAFKAYHNRELDGLPMQCKLDAFGVMPSTTSKSSASVLASRVKLESGKQTPPEVDPTLIQKALFKSSGTSSTPVRPVTFTVKL